MTTGAILFAQNTANVDYVKLAIFAASKIKEHLDIPVSLITDSRNWLNKTYPNHNFDQVIDIYSPSTTQRKRFNDGTLNSDVGEWKNQSRNSVYNLTPYDKTLVIDSDYIINSSILSTALANDYDLQIYKRSMDLASWRPTSEFQRINQYSVPFYWATTFIFQKNSITEAFFTLVNYIKDNWLYFKTLYSIDVNLFRNDYAFSIAIHIMNGKTNGEFATELPGTMIYVHDKDFLVSATGADMKFLLEKENFSGEYTLAKTSGLDVHVMNKYSLSRFIDGGSGV